MDADFGSTLHHNLEMLYLVLNDAQPLVGGDQEEMQFQRLSVSYSEEHTAAVCLNPPLDSAHWQFMYKKLDSMLSLSNLLNHPSKETCNCSVKDVTICL